MLKWSNSTIPWRDPDGKLTNQSWSCIAVKIFWCKFPFLIKTFDFDFDYFLQVYMYVLQTMLFIRVCDAHDAIHVCMCCTLCHSYVYVLPAILFIRVCAARNTIHTCMCCPQFYSYVHVLHAILFILVSRRAVTSAATPSARYYGRSFFF